MDKTKRDKYLKIFRAEAEEHLKSIRENLLLLERQGGDQEALNSVLRSAHTIKGSSRMVGLEEIGKMAHRMEDLLKAIEEGKQQLNGPNLELLLRGLELIERMIINPDQVDEKTQEMMVQCLVAAAEGKKYSAGPAPSAPAATESGVKLELEPARTLFKESLRVEASRLDQMINFSGQLMINRVKLEGNLFFLKRVQELLEGILKNCRESIGKSSPEIFHQLESVNDQLRELHQVYYDDLIELEHNAQETHYQALSLRMFPISILFEEFPMAVRELARELGKKIELKLEGGESELDRRVLDELRGPMVHLLRNACDHGIETPEQRLKAGKPEMGQVRISAYPKGNQVEIVIADDGKGINYDRIRAKAVEEGFLNEKQAEAVTEDELRQYLFRPGFTTSKIVTEVSGRGVGLDVVKIALERLGGEILVESEPGRGTMIRLQVPFTLAILRCVLAMVEEVVYIFPMHFLDGTLRVKREHLQTDRGMPLVQFQQEMIPVYSLGDLLGFDTRMGWPQQNGYLMILVASYSQQRVGLVVDKVLREEEVVTKTFGYPLAGQVRLVSGSTLLRGEEIGLILNVIELFEEIRRKQTRAPEIISPVGEKKKISVMVVDDSLTSRIVQRNVLEQAGYQVDLSENGIEALEKVEKKDYAILMVDIEMPGMNGFELTKRLRANPKTKRIPVIIISTRSGEEDRRKGVEAGAQGYMVKSKFDPQGLVEMIKHLIGE